VVGDMVNILSLVHTFVVSQLPTDVTQITDGQGDAILQKIIENIKLTDMRRQLVQTLYEAGTMGFDSETVQKYIVNEANATTSKALDANEGDIELF
jgi:hypothetical protein